MYLLYLNLESLNKKGKYTLQIEKGTNFKDNLYFPLTLL